MEQPDDDLGLQTVGGISWSVTLLGRGETCNFREKCTAYYIPQWGQG